jgi:hypothetical protein
LAWTSSARKVVVYDSIEASSVPEALVAEVIAFANTIADVRKFRRARRTGPFQKNGSDFGA